MHAHLVLDDAEETLPLVVLHIRMLEGVRVARRGMVDL